MCAVSTSRSALADLPLNAFDSGWKAAIGAEFSKPYFKQLDQFLRAERASKTIYPSEPETFTAFSLVPFEDVRVVIIGQDPYPGVEINKTTGAESPLGHGLAFSVRPEIKKIPGSLLNMFKKLKQDLDLPMPTQGSLVPWARQGVLMINATLTVEKGLANSHFNKPSKSANWGVFTDAVIEAVASQRKGVVFILWGGFAQKKKALIAKYAAASHHLILEGAHPSPLSAKLFLNGPKFFNLTNDHLKQQGGRPIDWRLP